ncbi:MAG: hypothetical protein QOJ08_615 [Ilumatobacteraceae bacterium]
MDAHLILWADARRVDAGYGRLMQPLHVLPRDVRASVWDFAVAGAMVVVAIVALITRIDVQDVDAHRFEADTWWSWAVTITVCVLLIGRRRWPLRTLAVGLVLVLPLELGGHRDSVAFFAVVIALGSVAAYLSPRMAWRGVAMIAGLYVALIAGGATILIAAPAVGPVLLAAGFALGRTLRQGHVQQELDVDAAIAQTAAAIETAELAAAQERLRMAQELHDVVAHSLSVIAVQAGIGAHLIDREPAQAALALDAIRTTGNTAGGELARLVQLMRGGGAAAVDAPALKDVAGLVEQIRITGVPITLTTQGSLADVPAGVSLAAYRIVQEALTNVVRHAGDARATVTVEVTDDHVEVCVEDDGRGVTTALDSASPGSGHGLIGMAERAQMYGGDVRAGLRPGGGFRVHATLSDFGNPSLPDAPATTATIAARVDRTHDRRPALSPGPWDFGLAGLIAGVAALELFGTDSTVEPHYSPATLLTWALKIGCCLAVAFRHRYPTATYATVLAMSIALHVGGYKIGLIIFALAISLFTVARYTTPRGVVAAVVAMFAELAIVASSEPREVKPGAAVWICILLAAVAAGGHGAGRDRQRRTRDLARREDAAQAHARRAQLVITTERLRIADELSTIITRSIHTIANEADTGSHLATINPAETRITLESISAISRNALNDLRRLLKRIRTDRESVACAPSAVGAPITAGDPG